MIRSMHVLWALKTWPVNFNAVTLQSSFCMLYIGFTATKNPKRHFAVNVKQRQRHEKYKSQIDDGRKQTHTHTHTNVCSEEAKAHVHCSCLKICVDFDLPNQCEILTKQN